MNILEWALCGKDMADYFERVEDGWYIDNTEKLPGGYLNGVLGIVVDYFAEELGLELWVGDCHGNPGGCCGYSYYHGVVSDEQLKKTFDQIMVVDQRGAAHWDAEARSPYYQLRGKRISREQALEVIARTDVLFEKDHYEMQNKDEQFWSDYDKWFEDICKKGYVVGRSDHFDNNYLKSLGYFAYKGGYVWPDGRVGLNYWMYKLPDMSEIICRLMDWATRFSCLDMVIVITKWDEMSPKRWMEWRHDHDDHEYDAKEHLDEYQKPYEPITVEDVDLCIEVKHGCITFPKPEDGLRKLAEYDSLYTEEERRQFPQGAFMDNTFTMPFDEEYFVKILTFYGDIPNSVMDALLERFRKYEKACREHRLFKAGLGD